MKLEAVSVRLVLLVAMSAAMSGVVLPGAAQVATDGKADESDRGRTSVMSVTESVAIHRLRDRPQPATTVKGWLAQIEAATVQVTNVKLERTETGLDIVLETAEGKPLQVDATQFRAEGNSLIADIFNAVLSLPDAQSFNTENPTADIATVQVVQQDVNTIRVSVTGNTAPPTTEVTLKTGELAYSLNPEGDEPDEEIVVTGEGQPGYRVPNSSTVTRTDTPLRDIPQSIQIIPQELLRDQRADVTSALLNAPSARVGSPSSFDAVRVQVRGFFTSPTLDGIVGRDFNGVSSNIGPDLTGIDRIEVIGGPNSVLFGSSSPGGTINFVTKRPLRDPYYFAEATVGSFSFYRGEIDLSGPLDNDKKILYRLNASYRDQEFFTDFSRRRNLVIAPVISGAIGDNTTLTIEGAFKNLLQDNTTNGLPAVGTIFTNPNGKVPRNRNITEGESSVTQLRIGYKLEHKFSENWSFSNAFRYGSLEFDVFGRFPGALRADNRTLPTSFVDVFVQYLDYRMTTNVVGKFSTGSIKHQLLFGFDLGRLDSKFIFTGRAGTPIDLFNPVFGQSPGAVTFSSIDKILTDELGILLQDQITLADNLKLLLGGRFDTFKQTGDFGAPELSQSGSAFSPRLGIVYQPILPISLYANYSRSFEPTIGRSRTNSVFQPSRGTQFEVGVKADLNDQLSTTLAWYNITQTNVLTADPVDDNFSVQTGEQKSQGVELSIAGEILPGWNIFASYAYNDARITQDNNPILVDNRVQRTTPHAASLWTTYEIQQGDLQGLGFGLGLFYVGDRVGDNANTFELPSYLTTDAAIFYKRNQFRAAINIKNLFNVEYFEGSFNRNRIFYGAPLTVEGTISWTF